MGIRFDAVAYTNVSTNSVISTKPGFFFGLSLIPKTTGVVLVYVYDATATATGTAVFGYRAASTAGTTSLILNAPIACRTGIYLSTPTITSGADQVVVFYAKA